MDIHGYTKKLRQNGTIPGFSASFIKKIIDNPVYMGKIAYGRRRTEKKTGTRNETHVVEQSDFPVYEGVHEAIIAEEDWKLAQEKRSKNNYKREKIHDPEHAHILSGILKYGYRNPTGFRRWVKVAKSGGLCYTCVMGTWKSKTDTSICYSTILFSYASIERNC